MGQKSVQNLFYIVIERPLMLFIFGDHMFIDLNVKLTIPILIKTRKPKNKNY